MPNPIDNPELYDVFVLAGQEAPGLSEVTGAAFPHGWEERKGQGMDGATLARIGAKLVEFKVVVYLWESDHFEAWDVWSVPLYKEGDQDVPYDVYHPDLAAVRVSEAVILNVSQRELVDERGLYKYTIDMKKKRFPKPTYGIAKSTKTVAGKQYQQTAQSASDAKIQQLMKQLQDL